MIAKRSSYKLPLIVAILLHIALLVFLLIQLNLTSQLPAIGQNNSQIVHATIINSQQLAEQAAKIQAQQQAQKLQQQLALQKQQQLQQQKLAQQQAQQAEIKQQQLQQQQAALAQQKAQQAAQLAQQQAQQKQQQQLQQQQAAQLAQQQAQQKQQQLAKLKQADAQDLLQQQLSSESQQLNSARAQYVNSILDKYKALITNAIAQHWLIPDNSNPNLTATLLIHLAPGGMVLDVQVTQSSGDAALDRSAVAAVYKASPLPVPADPAVFNSFRELSLTVRPESVING